MALQNRGYISYSGSQVQENYIVPTCYPGIVQVRGEQFPLPMSKRADIVLENVKISRTPLFKDRRHKKWDDFVIQDLDRLEALCREKQPFTHALAGIGISGCRPMVSAKTAFTAAKALCGRVYRLPKDREWGRGPFPGVWEKAWEFVELLLPDFRSSRMSDSDWLMSMRGRRKRALTTAMKEYRSGGWRAHYSKFSSFVKLEMLPGFSKTGEIGRLESMVDRLIQGPADATHCIAGPWLKPLIHRLKELWTPRFPIFYGSTGPDALDEFLQRSLVDSAHQYFWCDFSMFDNTHSDASWRFMERLYARAGIADPDFWRVMDVWKSPSGKIGPLRYTSRVMNASGRDDTSLANGILNGFATFLSACAAWLRKDVMCLSLSDVTSCMPFIRLSVCGDDSIGSLPNISEERMSDFASRMSHNISLFGFEAKLEHSSEIHRAVYLGMRPYPVAGHWYWGRTIGRAAYKMGWVMLSSATDIMAHITGVCDMYSKMFRHVPILYDLAAKVVECRAGAKSTPFQDDPDRPWARFSLNAPKYDRSTIEYVAKVYDTSPSEVLTLVDLIRSVNQLPCVIDSPLLRKMVVFDDL